MQTQCIVQRIYDQSPKKNHLNTAPAGGHVNTPDKGVNATRYPVTINGNKVYSLYFEGGMGYRIDNTSGIAIKNEPETLYMVTSGKHVNGGCCFDYGNAETNNDDDGPGKMEAVYFGIKHKKSQGSGNGPWVMADLEAGLWAGNSSINNQNTPLTSDFVFAMVKGNTNGFALKGGEINVGPLKTMYDGPRPDGYQPMKKQGAIILGIGGDNSDKAIGTFFEGAMTYGYTTDDDDNKVYTNIVNAKYGS